MTRYVVVSAVRITDWMVRTPELRLLRGASVALRERTASAGIERSLGLRAPEDAGDVAGVVTVELEHSQDSEATADRLAKHLRGQLPAVEWEAWWAESEQGYVSAYLAYEAAALAGSRTGTVGRRSYLPATLDVPLAQSCDGCRKEPADVTRKVYKPDGEAALLGLDCHVRHNTEESSGVSIPGRPARDFGELAEKGGLSPTQRPAGSLGRKGSRNHLATIYADGNGVGGFMSALADNGGQGSDDAFAGLRKRVVGAIDEATKAAVEAASSMISVSDQEVRPFITHYVGGDDILVSVPASLAWTYVLALAPAFRKHLDEMLKPFSALLTGSVAAPAQKLSLGVGITFAHASHPFADTRNFALDAMKRAKKHVAGKEAVLSWLDLTAEDRVPLWRHATVSALHKDSAPAVFGLGPSARSVLSEFLRDLWPDPEQSQEPAREQIVAWAKRTGHEAFQEAFAAESDLRVLADQLSRARWWPAVKLGES